MKTGNRPPSPGDICAISEPDNWKRDALLFDKLYVPNSYERSGLPILANADVPPELTFNLPDFESGVHAAESAMGYIAHLAPELGYAGVDKLAYGSAHTGIITQVQRRRVAEACATRGIDAVPTYASEPGFEQEFGPGTAAAWVGALANIPVVESSAVEWGEILAFYQDPESVRKYRDLRLWLRTGLAASSVSHATDLIGQKVDDYAWALRKHGLKTVTGAFGQVFSWKEAALAAGAAAVATAVGGPVVGALTTGVFIAGSVGVLLAERKVDLEDVRRGPGREVAILYDIGRSFEARRRVSPP